MNGHNILFSPVLHLSFLAVLITALLLHTLYCARPGTKTVMNFPSSNQEFRRLKKKKREFYILKLSVIDYLSDMENDLFLFSQAQVFS